jgi:hypothetical protein
MRRTVAQEMERLLSQVDLLLVPSLRDEMLTISNFTGQPALTLRAGASCKFPKREATGLRTRAGRCRNSIPRAACHMASRS